jgi:hypothetical protein
MKDVEKVPSREFLSTVIILLRKAEAETGMSLVEWLESFEEHDDTMTVDAYDDKALRSALFKLFKELYPEKPKPLDPADWLDEDDDDMPVPEPLEEPDKHANAIEAEIVTDEDDEDLPPVIKLSQDE